MLTTNPKLGDIDAVAEPLEIRDKFNPTIPEAGILVNPEPLPSNDPENEPEYIVLFSSVDVLLAKEDDVELNAPEMLVAIWAELDNNPEVFNVLIADSFAVTLVLKLELAAPNAPEISDAIWDEPLNPPLNVPINEFAIILVLELISPDAVIDPKLLNPTGPASSDKNSPLPALILVRAPAAFCTLSPVDASNFNLPVWAPVLLFLNSIVSSSVIRWLNEPVNAVIVPLLAEISPDAVILPVTLIPPICVDNFSLPA